MIEIAIVVSCCVGLAGILKKKGRSPAGYIVLFVALWFGGEFAAGYLAGLFGVLTPSCVSWRVLWGRRSAPESVG